MDSNPICHPSPAKRMKCLFLDYLQLLMIGRAGPWTPTPAATPLQPIKWNAHFWITFNFWCSAGLVDGFEPHLPPLCSQKHEMLIFGLHSTSNDRPGWSMDSNSICHPSPAKKWNACFWITFNFWWSVGLVDGIEPHLPPLSSQKNEMLIFGLRSTSDDWPGWSMDLSPVCHLSAAKKMKCPFLDYIQLLMIGRAGPRTPTLSATPLQPKTWNACFWITFNFWWSARLVDALEPHLPPLSSQKNEMLIFALHSTPDDQPGWSMDSNPIYHLSPATKIKCSFLDYVQLLMISWIGQCHPPPLSSQKHEMLVFGLHSTSGDWPGWSMHSNPICHLSPAKKLKCSFLDYIQLLMISRAGRWNWTPSTTSLQPKKMKCSFLDYIQILMISQAGWWTRTPSATPLQPKEWNPNFWNTFNFSCLAGLVDGLKLHLPPISSQKNEMLIFGLCSTSDDQPGWSMDLNPICNPSPANKMKCSFLEYIQLLMISQAG